MEYKSSGLLGAKEMLGGCKARVWPILEAERQNNEEALIFSCIPDRRMRRMQRGMRDPEENAYPKRPTTHTPIDERLFNINIKNLKTIKEYVGRIVDIHTKLTAGGYALIDREMDFVMLMGISKNYEQLISRLEKEEEPLSTTVVEAKLMVEEKKISRNTEEVNAEDCGLFSTNQSNRRRGESVDQQGHKTWRKWTPKSHDTGTPQSHIPGNTKAKKCFSSRE